MPSCSSCEFDAPGELQFCPRCGGSIVDPLVGVLLGERYQIRSRIGTGGMGAVYRAHHTTLKRDLAVKVLLPELGGRDEFVRRFEREAESASRLSHPNIIAVTDFGRTPEGLLFLVMEFLDGQSLTAAIRQGPLGVARALAIARQILGALERAHAAGIVHRDLKPDNIMLIERDGDPDFVKILDFGIAKLTDPAPGREALTQAGVVFGTPEYLSPEQALGDVVDARSDLYATGVMLFEMLTGRRPFESEDKVRIISMHLSHAPPRFADVSPAVAIPEPIEEVVMQAMEKERENRFASAGAFLVALDEAEAAARANGVAPPDGGPAPSSAGAGAAAPPSSVVSLAASARAAGADVASGTDAGSTGRVRFRLGGRAVAGIAVAGVAIAALAFYPRHGARPKSVATARVPPHPAPAPAELAAQLRVVDGLLAAGEIVKVKVALEELQAEHPGNARIRYLFGRLVFAENRHGQAIDDYRAALALDAGFRGDTVLIDHLGIAVGEPKNADAALDVAIEQVGQPAADLLEKVANGNGELRRRERAARALEQLGEGRRVDVVALRIATLKKTAACEDKKPLVVALGKSEDPRALPVLRAQRSRGGIEGLFGAEPANACMKTELGEAIARVEAKLPQAEKSPAPPTAAHPTARRSSSSRSSIFRGR